MRKLLFLVIILGLLGCNQAEAKYIKDNEGNVYEVGAPVSIQGLEDLKAELEQQKKDLIKEIDEQIVDVDTKITEIQTLIEQ